MDNQYNYYNPNENSNNEDRQRMNSQSEGSQNGEQKGNRLKLKANTFFRKTSIEKGFDI